MSQQQIVPTFRRLRQLLAGADETTSDAQLLQRFVTQRDEAAFELLVWRHGPMVLGVCRRVLLDAHDAEDAFQATLLVLARKAAAIGKRECVGSWLYKVAYRVALRQRERSARRARHEQQADHLPLLPDHRGGEDPGWGELRSVLDEELNRLAEKHRAPVVLCYLEGLTNEEAARRLLCPVGTVKTRLSQARRLLGERLARRGLALATSLLVVEKPPLTAAPAGSLVAATVRAATGVAAGKVAAACAVSAPVACLMEGVLRAMMVQKVKSVLAALVLALAAVGAGTVSYQAWAAESGPGEPRRSESPPTNDSPAEAKVKRIRKQLDSLKAELARAEEDAARERAVPPQKKPVAVIFGDVPITRDELAEHLLSRLTGKQLEAFVNRRILEHACKEAGVSVTDEDVEACVKGELVRLNMTEQTFRTQILSQQKRTLREWKDDVVRTKLMLQKLQKRTQTAAVTDRELREAFEARYGEKVECDLMIFRTEECKNAERLARDIRAGRVLFGNAPNVHLFSRGGRGPFVVSRGMAELAKAAFALHPGEVSEAITLRSDKSVGQGAPPSIVIIKCRRRIPADKSVRFEDVIDSLRCDVLKSRKGRDEEAFFKDLQARARTKWLWTPPEDKDR
jgi:RNA polymerase sigma factor (sigma-70 family)